MPRISPLSPPYTEAVEETFSRLMPAGMEPLGLFRTLAVNPRVLRRVQRGGLLDPGSISLKHREIAILRTCFLCGAEYEWGVHAALFAAGAGLEAEHLSATTSLQPDPIWEADERLIVKLCDSLHDSGQVEDALYAELAGVFTDTQIIELVMLGGLYHAISFVVNVAQVEPEAWAMPFPVSAASSASS